MSMQTWLNDAQAFPNGDHGAFNPVSDPSTAYMQTATAANFDYNNQIQNPQLQQRLQNGAASNGSPTPPNPMYQTQQTIPSKRPRPREDGIATSPRQYPGGLPSSRAQTPQGAYPGYAGAVNGAHFPGASPYQQFQQGSANAGQSPVMQNQSYTPQPAQPRVQTMSPAPFSPSVQTFGAQASPPHSENGSRVNTPHNGSQTYPQAISYGVSANQSFTPPAAPGMNGAPQPQYVHHPPNLQQQQQMMFEHRMRHMHHASNGALQQRPQGSPLNPISYPANQMSAVQMAQARAQIPAQAQQRPHTMQQMLDNIRAFTHQRGIQYIPQPIITGRPINSVQLFAIVAKRGGSRNITAQGGWPNIAISLSIPLPDSKAAGQELQNYWITNLGAYEVHWMQNNQQIQLQHQHQHQQQQRQRSMADSMRFATHPQGTDPSLRQSPFSPSKQPYDQQGRHMQAPSQLQAQVQAQYQVPGQLPPQANARHPVPNGYLVRQPLPVKERPPMPDKLPLPPDPVKTRPGKVVSKKDAPEYWASRKIELEPFYAPQVNNLEQRPPKSDDDVKSKNADDEEALDHLNTNKMNSNWAIHHGGYPVMEPGFVENIGDLMKYKLSVPLVEELGQVDMRSLILSLRSGLHGEVRLALDTIVTLSILPKAPALDQCDDLVEALIECANDQVEFLAEHAAEVSDVMLINAYEENTRGCLSENESLLGPADFGTVDYDLGRAADRLICVTTILRNFSFHDKQSHKALTEPMVLKMLATVMRYLGTRDMLLRSYRNTLDFSKDVVTFLSHTSYLFEFSGKEEASNILHFLVSFAPLPEPNKATDQHITFSTYVPSLNRYLPHAVESLAKFLARESNRTCCRSIFAADAAASPPFDLLTRVFGLAIAPIPEIGYIGVDPRRTITPRVPFIAHGLLAAEILVGLIPPSENNLAPAWMASRDGFGSRLMKMISLLIRHHVPQAQMQHRNAPEEISDPFGYMMVINHGLAVLRKLAERAKDAHGPVKSFPLGILPNKQNILDALRTDGMEPDLVRQLCALSGLDT